MSIVSIEFNLEGRQPTILNIEQSASLYDPNAVSEEAAASNTSFEFSGRHDHGQLPRLNMSGPYLPVVRALYEAKIQTDIFLNQISDPSAKSAIEEKADSVESSSEDSDGGITNPNKKLKL
jgi:hypothetical protein